MTAEIAIMNRQAIALAADSAVTARSVKGQKIFTSAEKIFQLTNNAPIGIMVYGNASFMGVPWETVIKIYNQDCPKKDFNTLEQYSDDFINFLRKNRELFPAQIQKQYAYGTIESYFEFLKKIVLDTVRKNIERRAAEGKPLITEKEVRIITKRIVDGHYVGWTESPYVLLGNNAQVNKFARDYRNTITKIRKEVFEKLPMDKLTSDKIQKLAALIFFKSNDKYDKENCSGLVIAGFGKKDIFPCLHSYTIEGIVQNFLKFKKDNSKKVSPHMGAAIIPFAQKDMVVRFMEGVDPMIDFFIHKELQVFAEKYPPLIFKRLNVKKAKEKTDINKATHEIIGKFIEGMYKYRREKFVNPILDVVGMLPKNELAAMTETLVTLTSFKRRVSMDEETVGGPIDVVVISKGDGLVWARRKENFNQRFISGKYDGK